MYTEAPPFREKLVVRIHEITLCSRTQWCSEHRKCYDRSKTV